MPGFWMPNIPYAHKPIQEKSFIFPITGLQLAMDTSIFVGKVQFVDKIYLEKNIINHELAINLLFKRNFDNIKTFAIVDLTKYGDYAGVCPAGNNSLALQILKQTIGAIYLSMFNKKDGNLTFERRIVISNKAVHEVDEGLNPYMVSIYDGNYKICPNEVDKALVGSCSDFDLDNIKNIVTILEKNIKDKTEYEQKICKTLEVVYSIYNESYSRERVIKWAILLNYLFREDNKQSLDSPDIGRKLRIIFNVMEKKQILENIPRMLVSKPKKTKKISDIVIDIYSRVRNDLMHGKIDFYTEYAVCNLEDMLILKVIVMELLNIMSNDTYLNECKTIKEFDLYVEKKEKENIESHKKK